MSGPVDDVAPRVSVRFWAGAQRAAGHDTEQLRARTVGELRGLLGARPELSRVSSVASFLVDSVQAADSTVLHEGAEVDVLPPFAGGAPLIVGLGGSPRPDSTTSRLLERCLTRVRDLGARTRLVPAADLIGLPIYTGPSRSDVGTGLLEAVRAADCLVIATPGYHGGMSGLVKNALDHLEELREDPRPYLDGRAVGVIVSAAGWQACGTAVTSLRSAIHALRGWPTPFAMTVNSAEQSLDDPRMAGGLDILAGQLVQFAGWQQRD